MTRSLLGLLLLGTALIGALVPTAFAQIGDDEGPYTGPPDVEAPADPGPMLELPDNLPAIVDFSAMLPFEVDGSTPNTFALDPASLSLRDRYVLATVAVRSPSGAVTSGYYGFACDYAQYKLLAYPRKNGQWQAASQKVRWRDVQDAETRNRQFRAVFRAGCRIGGETAESTEEVLRHLREGRRVLSP